MVLGFGRGYPFPSKENDRLNIFGRPNGKFIEAKTRIGEQKNQKQSKNAKKSEK
jgi:hypothetical protein